MRRATEGGWVVFPRGAKLHGVYTGLEQGYNIAEMGKYCEENGVSLRIISFVGTSLFMARSQPET
jgi:hypothetical protein